MDEEWFAPLSWGDFEKEHWETRFGPYDVLNDSIAQAYYHDAYFNRDVSSEHRIAVREAFDNYMSMVYDIDIDVVFDWDAWREAYGEGLV